MRQHDRQFLDEHCFLVTEIETANGTFYLAERTLIQKGIDEVRVKTRAILARLKRSLKKLNGRAFLMRGLLLLRIFFVRLWNFILSILHLPTTRSDFPSTTHGTNDSESATDDLEAA